ncbi:FeoA family protein [Persephonella sp.]
MKLSDLPAGSLCRIKELQFDPTLKRKLLEMGLIPGQIVEVIQVSPFGGPVKIKIKGYCLAVRKSDAEKIIVEECNGK